MSGSVEKPRIGYLLKRFPRLSETFVVNELLALHEQGFEVEVFSLNAPEPQQQRELLARLPVPVWYLPDRQAVGRLPLQQRRYHTQWQRETHLKGAMGEVPAERAPFPGKRPGQCAVMTVQAAVLAALAQGRGIAHLHAHFASDAATVAMLASRLSGIPFSITAHAKDIFHTYSDRLRDEAFLAQKLMEARFVVTVSDYNRRYLERLTDGRAVVHRIYNGVDLERLAFYDGPRTPHHVVAVGRLVEKKGFVYLIEACAHLRREGHPLRCTLIGDGPERAALQARAAALGVADRIRFEGAQPQEVVWRAMRRASLFALPCVVGERGDRDGLPTVLLESLALGTLPVSTRVAGIPEIIEDGESGWLVPQRDAIALARALAEGLDMAPERYRAMSHRARRRAERLFDLRRNAQALGALFCDQAGGVRRLGGREA